MNPRAIGDHLGKRRLDLGLSLIEFGRRLGVDPETVRNWEEGRRKPQLRFLPTVYEFLGYCLHSPVRTLGDRVRRFREGGGLSMSKIARMLGLDEGTVRRLERGITRRPLEKTCRLVHGFFRVETKSPQRGES